MEHRTSASSKDNGGQFSGHLNMYGSTYQIQPLTAPSFFSGSSSSSCPPSRALAHKSEHGSTYLSDLSGYMKSFPYVDGRSSADSSSHVWTCGPSPQMDLRLEAPQGMPPEALLDVISNTQHKLKHLEALARIMIQERRHHGIAQQQQSLSMEFASVMSQLFATTANFSSSSWIQAASPPPPQVNDTFDFSFDGLNEDELHNTLGGGSFYPPLSGIDVTNSEICERAGVHLSAEMMDSRATKVGIPVASSDEAAKVFNSVNEYTNIAESYLSKGILNGPPEISKNCMVHDSEDHREDDDDGEGESLPPGSYDLVELAATEILAEHTHFCEICSKGFKRDANLRMHMRGHGDEYKTAAALARPDKMPRDASVKLRRYSCPYAGCKRNKKHPKFQSLKTMLCVKNHYRRSHCPKLLVCGRCKVKKFSVVADLKTHEKHCGQDKWQCSCGTTFSRKDKLYGHIGLFAGHTPATLTHEIESLPGFGDGLEVLASSEANASGTAGLPAAAAIALQDNVAANYADVTQGMNSYSVSVMDMRANQNDVSVSEQSLNHREKTSFLSFDGGIRESSFPSGSSTGIFSPDGMELQSLLTATDGLFHQGGGTN